MLRPRRLGGGIDDDELLSDGELLRDLAAVQRAIAIVLGSV